MRGRARWLGAGALLRRGDATRPRPAVPLRRERDAGGGSSVLAWPIAFVALAACDLGIGSDPHAPYTPACVAGHVVVGASCVAPSRDIAIDGGVADWDGVPAIALAAPCEQAPCEGLVPRELWLATRGDPTDIPEAIAIRVRFDAAVTPSTELRLAWMVSPSSQRPASGGFDRLVLDGAQLSYAKNGLVLDGGVDDPGYAFATTSDGFEALLAQRWLTHQGVSRVAVAVERRVGEAWVAVAPSEPVTMCWGFEGFEPRPCEVIP